MNWFNNGVDQGMNNQMVNMLSNLESEYEIDKIIKALQTNRSNHVEEYNQAYVVYCEDLKKKVKETNRMIDRKEFDLVNVSQNFGLTKPVNCESQYDDLINVFNNMSDTTSGGKIKLSVAQADHVFNDNWEFKVSANLINSTYYARFKKF